jgi:alpha-N-arabinofuranosidase
MILTEGDKTLRTPAYWAFDLEKPHRNKVAVGVEAEASGYSVCASRDDKSLVITLANPTHDEPRQVECDIVAASVASPTARILHHADMNAHNSFDRPDALMPVKHVVERDGSKLSVALPPLSVVTVEARLA